MGTTAIIARPPRVDPTEKMRYRLSKAYRLIDKYGETISETLAWELRKFYRALQKRETEGCDFDGGPIVKKNKELGFQSGMTFTRFEFAAFLSRLMGVEGRAYPYENKAVAELVYLADAYDLRAAWKTAEQLGNLCLLPGWLTPKD